jgi:hypothetical protein
MTTLKHIQLAIIAALYIASGGSVAAGDGYPWKNGDSFEIDYVGGTEHTFEPGARIELEVLGRSLSTNVPPDPEYGFHVQVSIDHPDLSRSVTGANGEWDEGLRGWFVTLAAPQEPLESYRLRVSLYCADDSSACAETYGRAAQVSETSYFDVR